MLPTSLLNGGFRNLGESAQTLTPVSREGYSRADRSYESHTDPVAMLAAGTGSLLLLGLTVKQFRRILRTEESSKPPHEANTLDENGREVADDVTSSSASSSGNETPATDSDDEETEKSS